MHPLATFSAFLSFVVFSSSIKLPSSYKKCAIQDKVCLGTNFEAGIRYASKGLPAYGLVSLDPLLLPELTIGAGKSVVNLQQFYKNVSFTGFFNIKVEDFEVDLDKGILTIKQSYPGFLMNAEYNMMGKILVLPVFGNGHCTVTLEKVKPVYQAKFDLISRKGEKYMRITSEHYTLNASFAKYNFENVFNGDKILGAEINKVINDNWKEIYDEVIPGYESAIGMLLTNIANRFLNRVPVSALFL
ncbi:hypothetical protein WA026_021925 [Henosepilachna vigintioctopunctata]|uniref:Protein takeout n=1 Tax=Henosepilachna vigintioctopunctata TaxID=420089 RepID=A0AAW1VGK7_9CUCU